MPEHPWTGPQHRREPGPGACSVGMMSPLPSRIIYATRLPSPSQPAFPAGLCVVAAPQERREVVGFGAPALVLRDDVVNLRRRLAAARADVPVALEDLRSEQPP